MIKHLIECHKFFIRESRSFVGVQKNSDKSYPIFGDNKYWKEGMHERLKWTVVDIGYEKYWHIPFKMKLYYPIAYIKFMYYSIKDFNRR